ncbi:MAG: AtpZ/AtpI family protein [Erysipelothrix sp.]|nr:AtpZ/AtpI family protein [Erysipelothrix sp.]
MEPSNSSWIAKALGLGLNIGLTLLFSVLLGLWLDKTLNTQPWLLIIFVMIGIINVFKILFDWSKS